MNGMSAHRIHELPVLVLLPHNRCNCRCVMCDIWKIRSVREITSEDLAPHLSSLRSLKVKWVVFSGGEPLMHSDLSALCRMLRMEGIRLTLLTAGLSLERHAQSTAELFDDVIVSLDGPPEIHDRIRGVTGAYRHLLNGVRAIRRLCAEKPIHARCTVQKENCRALRGTVRTAHDMELNSISFLSADVWSTAFNRTERWTLMRQSEIALSAVEVDELDRELSALIEEHGNDIESGFIVERADKLRRISRHFRACLGREQPVAPRCNAPWVSAVVEADGTVKPCFFHDPVGNIHDGSLADILNGAAALNFRSRLDIATNSTCRSCVCSLFLPQPHTAGQP